MANQPLPYQEGPPLLPEPSLGKQFISGLSANNNSNLLAGQFRDVYIGESRNLNDVLNSLPAAIDAPFNAYHRQSDPTCLPNTRTGLLQDVDSWADGQDNRCIFWLSGLAGTGKSTIARTLARTSFEKQCLGASFFFSRGSGDTSNASKFVTSIAKQLADSVPSLEQHICDSMKKCRDIVNQSLRDQWQQLVLHPLSKLGDNSSKATYVLVVDALDECDNDENIQIIIKLFGEARSLKKIRLRIFLTSRPEPPIRYGFEQLPAADHQDFVLHDISSSVVNDDIRTFLEKNLKNIAKKRFLAAGWPGDETISRLVQRASGLFIWADTACRFISNSKFAKTSLDMILVGSSTTINAPEKHLNEIYITVLRHCIQLYPDEAKKLQSMLKRLLGSIVTLLSPLSTQSLGKLLSTAQDEVDQTLDDLHAILSIPKDPTLPLRLHHPSFRDFLYEKARSEEFWVDEKQAHQALADGCRQLMSTSLKQDMCGVDAPGMLVADAERSRIERNLPPEVQYACLYWIEHLQKSGAQLHDNDQVHQFLQQHLLHWLQALSWMRRISEGILATRTLESITITCDSPQLSAFIHDVKRFALNCRSAIEQAPLQTYCSALIFAPDKSLVRKQFEDKIPKWMKRFPKVYKDWSAALQTLEGHTSWVGSVAFSPDGALLASASGDKTVRVWDAKTGTALQTLKGHTEWVNSVAFSPDGALLASASRDKTVRVWDAKTGTALQRIALASYVEALSFTSDGSSIMTDRGLLRVKGLQGHDPLGVSAPHVPQPHIFLDGNWVLRDSEKLLWLPVGYRGSSCSAVKDGIVVLGYNDGRVIFMEIG